MANYVLEILDGDRAGEVLPVGDAVLRIGRKSGNDLVLADEKTSGVHCEIAPEGDRLVLKDLGSTNGTFLDGKRVTEMVLTPGDVVTVGRLRVKFRSESDDVAAAGGDDGEFSLRKLDAARLQKRGSPIGLLLILLVVLGGGGGYWWWMQQEQQTTTGRTKAQKRRDPMAVSGNRLDQALATCESDEEGWQLKAAGLGFRATGDAHTGDNGFAAYRGDDAGGEDGAAATRSEDDYAILRLAEPLEVFAGRTLTLAAYCRTVDDAQIGVRAVAFADSEDSPFRYVSGSKIAVRDGWERVEAIVTVPPGCDRLQVEIVAVLPSDSAEANVDDIAITEGGDKNGIVHKLASGLTALGFGAAVAVRSADPQRPATVLAIVPDEVPAALKKLHAAGQGALSDVGATITCTAEERGFAFEASGVGALKFVLPSDSGSGLMVAAEDGVFASTAAASEFSAKSVLFGSFGTRGMLQFESATSVRGEPGGGVYGLSVRASKATLAVGFRSERLQAGNLVRQARAAHADDRPGEALDTIAKVFATWPMDSEELGNAQQLRSQILAEQEAAARKLQKDFEEAGFFDTRGGYERVREGVDQLVALYGEGNVEGLAEQRALQAKAAARLQAFDRTTYKAQRERLTALADAFGAASRPGLQKMVQNYIARHLPEAPDEGEGDGTSDPDGGKD